MYIAQDYDVRKATKKVASTQFTKSDTLGKPKLFNGSTYRK
jgi:hypothetical protein